MNATPVNELKFSAELFLNRSTTMYGGSGTGKTTVVKHIMYLLKEHVDQIMIFCPTDCQNGAYSGSGIVPRVFIHDSVTPEILKQLWERQESLAGVYRRANNVETLARLFARMPDERYAQYIRRAIAAYERNLAEARASGPIDEDDINKIAQRRDEVLMAVYKYAITKNRAALAKLQLSEAERFSLTFFDLNPNMMIIFDDCTEQINKMKKDETIQKMFYQCRHLFLTVVFSVHDDKALGAELKKSAMNIIFTERTIADCYFGRPSNNFDKLTIKRAGNAISCAFDPTNKHQKLYYSRDAGQFYRFIAKKHGSFRFGADLIWAFNEEIKSSGAEIPMNKYSAALKMGSRG
jgi:ABC-type dipeptide/oligopeptide/nickel transport system ATPase subunit